VCTYTTEAHASFFTIHYLPVRVLPRWAVTSILPPRFKHLHGKFRTGGYSTHSGVGSEKHPTKWQSCLWKRAGKILLSSKFSHQNPRFCETQFRQAYSLLRAWVNRLAGKILKINLKVHCNNAGPLFYLGNIVGDFPPLFQFDMCRGTRISIKCTAVNIGVLESRSLNYEKQLSASSYVCPSARNTSAPIGRILTKFDI
jgi:hypothetical protein